MQVHVIHEIDCSVERIDPAVVEAFLDTELSDDPMLADSICAMADAMSAELHPRRPSSSWARWRCSTAAPPTSA